MQAPPTSLIFFSATFEKKRALTMTGCLGRFPLPKTLKNPARVMSMTGAFFSLVAYFSLENKFFVSQVTNKIKESVNITVP
jgi:hypothetical protein